MLLLYNLFLKAYVLSANILSIKNAKAKLWIQGRRNLLPQIANSISKNKKPVIWFHCSSLGEFEQGKPLIEALKNQYTNYCIVLTFFSPSGYEVQKKYKGAHYIFYLPMDGKKNAANFLSIIQPQLAVFIKYDYWYYYLQQLKKNNVPTFIVSAVYRHSQPFFKWYGSLHRVMLTSFTHFFVQDEKSKNLLNTLINKENITVSGDTRFDRVVEIAAKFCTLPIIENFVQQQPVLVAGSTWPDDDEVLTHFINQQENLKCIIAPHVIDNEYIQECLKNYKGSIQYSVYKNLPSIQQTKYHTLIIDNVGMLSSLYAYATITYVGGGFGNDGVHNVLEPAVFGKPVIFGPEFSKYREAEDLINANGGFTISNTLAFEKLANELLNNAVSYKKAAESARNFVLNNAGATEKIMRVIYEKRLLIN